MHVIKQIGVVSLGKIMGVSGFLMGLIVGIPWGLILIAIGALGGAAASGENAEAAGGLVAGGIGGGLFIMIGMPIMMGLGYFIFGLIYGLILNLVFGIAGGLEIQLEPAQRM